jgi:hypothetical protein
VIGSLALLQPLLYQEREKRESLLFVEREVVLTNIRKRQQIELCGILDYGLVGKSRLKQDLVEIAQLE